MGTDKRARQKAARQAKIEELQQRERKTATKRRTTLIGGGVVAFIVVVIGFSILTSNDDDGDASVVADSSTTTAVVDEGECPAEDGSSPQVQSFSAPPPMCIDTDTTYIATMTTDVGDIVIELDPAIAPQTVNNFVTLARYHFYDGLTFHRVVDDFVIQGGDPAGNGSGGPGYQFPDELPDPDDYQVGSLAMANSGPDTNGSQFFIVTSEKGAETLVEAVGGRAAYSLFGQVTEGMDVVLAIEADGPDTTHVIESVVITEA